MIIFSISRFKSKIYSQKNPFTNVDGIYYSLCVHFYGYSLNTQKNQCYKKRNLFPKNEQFEIFGILRQKQFEIFGILRQIKFEIFGIYRVIKLEIFDIICYSLGMKNYIYLLIILLLRFPQSFCGKKNSSLISGKTAYFAYGAYTYLLATAAAGVGLLISGDFAPDAK